MHQFAEFIHRFAESVRPFATQFGGPGLFLVALLDSSVLTLPEASDVLVAAFSMRDPQRWWYYAAVAMLGSVAGSSVLYAIARKGGERVIRGRFRERHIARALDWFQRYGALVLIVASMLPPPVPLKLFVLLAGLAGMTLWKFAGSVALGRGLRYAGEAWLARSYGNQAAQFVRQHLLEVLIPLGIFAVGGTAVWWLVRRRRYR